MSKIQMMLPIPEIEAKLGNWAYAQKQVKRWQDLGQEVTFTNGCFDILHYGHLHYLAEASQLGDKLVIGLNGTDSVKRLKGRHRPIQDEQTRLYMLASLQFVDLVVLFAEDTPAELIRHLEPDLLVKGGDYKIEEIVGADTVLAKGGTVKTLAFVEGFSTTNIENKIKNQP
jgi:rfaE bifunctional protein nucleotidyltransferase chain/domain